LDRIDFFLNLFKMEIKYIIKQSQQKATEQQVRKVKQAFEKYVADGWCHKPDTATLVFQLMICIFIARSLIGVNVYLNT